MFKAVNAWLAAEVPPVVLLAVAVLGWLGVAFTPGQRLTSLERRMGAMEARQAKTVLVAGALMPWLGGLAVVKPSIGLATFAAYPTRRALIGGAFLVLLSILVYATLARRLAAEPSELTPPHHTGA